MTIVDIGIFFGVISLFHCYGDFKKYKHETEDFRQQIQRACIEKKARNIQHYTVNGIEINDCNCKPPRWGTKRRWYERKTYKEVVEDFEGRLKK